MTEPTAEPERASDRQATLLLGLLFLGLGALACVSALGSWPYDQDFRFRGVALVLPGSLALGFGASVLLRNSRAAPLALGSTCLGCAGYPVGGLLLALGIAKWETLPWTAVFVVAMVLATVMFVASARWALKGTSRAEAAVAYAVGLTAVVTVVWGGWETFHPRRVDDPPEPWRPPAPPVDPTQVEAPDPPPAPG